MICSEFRELLDRYESIDELDRECMDAHCDFCDDCRSEMEFFKSITAISASIPCPTPPKTLIAEVNAKLDKMAVAPVGAEQSHGVSSSMQPLQLVLRLVLQ